jgi:hypothetical protein
MVASARCPRRCRRDRFGPVRQARGAARLGSAWPWAAFVIALVALSVAACGPRTASPAPGSGAPASPIGQLEPGATPALLTQVPGTSTPPVGVAEPRLGIDWGRAASVERPEEAFAQPSPGASIAFSTGTGTSGHPLHFPGQAIMSDVVVRPGGDLVAVGYVGPRWRPTAWTSATGMTWDLQAIVGTEFTFPVALAAGPDGALVGVGRSGSTPRSWTSPDGRAWTPHDVGILGDGTTAERMTTVVATRDGYLAGGSVGPELFERHARFWSSRDGVTWTPVPDDPIAFADAEVRSIAPFGSGFVAIGVTGTVQEITGSVAWTSPDGRGWTRHDPPDLSLGRAVSVIEAPFGGLVAVGSGLNEEEALAWWSADGVDWRIAPDEASRQYAGKIRMTDVVAVGDVLVGVGNYVGMQRGTAVSWLSRDAVRWEEARSAPVQEQVELYAVAAAGPGIVAVGSFGAPDDYIPTVLLSPAR